MTKKLAPTGTMVSSTGSSVREYKEPRHYYLYIVKACANADRNEPIKEQFMGTIAIVHFADGGQVALISIYMSSYVHPNSEVGVHYMSIHNQSLLEPGMSSPKGTDCPEIVEAASGEQDLCRHQGCLEGECAVAQVERSVIDCEMDVWAIEETACEMSEYEKRLVLEHATVYYILCNTTHMAYAWANTQGTHNSCLVCVVSDGTLEGHCPWDGHHKDEATIYSSEERKTMADKDDH